MIFPVIGQAARYARRHGRAVGTQTPAFARRHQRGVFSYAATCGERLARCNQTQRQRYDQSCHCKLPE
jgi:hypothetical protein